MANHGISEADVAHVLAWGEAEHLDRRGNRRITGAVGGRIVTVMGAAGSGSVPARIIRVWDRGSA